MPPKQFAPAEDSPTRMELYSGLGMFGGFRIQGFGVRVQALGFVLLCTLALRDFPIQNQIM